MQSLVLRVVYRFRICLACRALGGGGDHSARVAPFRSDDPAQHVAKDLREIQELLRHKNIRTTVRYTHVGCERPGRLRRRLVGLCSESWRSPRMLLTSREEAARQA